MTRQDATLVELVGGRSGPILPAAQLELRRRIRLSGGATVSGGVLGHTVEVAGPVAVAGAIFATHEITLTAADGPLSVAAPVAARSAISGTGSAAAALIIEGDVHAPRVRLQGAVVVGAVLAEHVILEDCIVFGMVDAARILQLRDSFVSGFCAGAATLEGRVILGAGSAIARDALELERAQVASAVLCDLRADRDGPPPLVSMSSDDIQTVVVHAPSGQREPRLVLTLARRAMDLRSARPALEENLLVLRQLARRHHLPLAARADAPTPTGLAARVRRWIATMAVESA